MAKKYAIQFYQSKQWEDCRLSYLKSKDYMCERCLVKDLYVVANTVHHKIYITPDNINNINITLNHNNLECLCVECHQQEHHSTDPNKDYVFDINGNLINKIEEVEE
jgi:5-methylcytosine-specific restriction endonuclease McrA